MRLFIADNRFSLLCFFFFNDTATTEIYTLSLHDALPISDPSQVLSNDSLWIDLRLTSEQSPNLDAQITEALNPLQISHQPEAPIEAQAVSIENGQVRLVANTSSPQVGAGHITACTP